MQHNNSAVLMLSTLTADYLELSHSIKDTDLFEDVFVFDDRCALKVRSIHANHNSVSVDRKIADNVAQVEQLLPVKLQSYDELFICADHFPIGIYVNAKGLPYKYFEEGNGQQSRTEVTIEHTIKRTDPYLYPVVKQLKLYGENDNVISRYVNLDAQADGYSDARNVDFSVSKLLKKLSLNVQAMLLSIFKIDKFDSTNGVLFMPQHNVNLNVFTIEQQLYQSSLLIDYFCSGKPLVIKPHPSDDFCDYSKIFHDATILKRKFPSELLTLISDNGFSCIITAWSTAVHSLKDIATNIICFSHEIDMHYVKLHRYHLASALLSRLNSTVVYSFCTYNAMLKPLCTSSITIIDGYDNPPPPQSVCIFDTASILPPDWEESRVAIFINSNEDAVFFNGNNYLIFGKMLLFSIAKSTSKMHDIYSDINFDDERVWVYVNNDKDREQLEGVGYIKTLPCSQMVTAVNLADDDFELPSKHEVYRNTKMLEGILAATEQRLSELIDRNKV